MLDSIKDASCDIKNGKMIIIVDDENRENEGDLVCSAEKITPEVVNFMTKYGRGLICVPMEKERLEKLNINQMVLNNTDKKKTAFTISVDYKINTTTGISAFDRYETIKALASEMATKNDFIRPGHIFPLESKKLGVLERKGHTEAAVDLMKIAKLYSVGVICEILNEDGTMARMKDLEIFKNKFNLKMISVENLIEYRWQNEIFVEKFSQAYLPTKFGNFEIIIYKNKIDNKEHVVLKNNKFKENPFVRIHSSCFTGDILGSMRCDCQEQLYKSLEMINEFGGILIYLNQERRGIGLGNKIKAYKLQEEGLDTVDANLVLGFKSDLRDYGIAAQILKDLKINNIFLLTNNPDKINGLRKYGINIQKRIPIIINSNNYNSKYLKIKKEKMGHIF